MAKYHSQRPCHVINIMKPVQNAQVLYFLHCGCTPLTNKHLMINISLYLDNIKKF